MRPRRLSGLSWDSTVYCLSLSGYVKLVITGYSQIQLVLQQHAKWILQDGNPDPPILDTSMESDREDKRMTDIKDYKGSSLIQSSLRQVLTLLSSPVDILFAVTTYTLFLRAVMKNHLRVEWGKAVSAKGTPTGSLLEETTCPDSRAGVGVRPGSGYRLPAGGLHQCPWPPMFSMARCLSPQRGETAGPRNMGPRGSRLQCSNMQAK